MKLSVAMITYNHEPFIAQAIESVLMQETDFEFELVIGEDYSTDKTRGIVTEYRKMYPDKIRLLLPETNLGMNKNFAQTLLACKGQYIALLEGDDYWTANNKLQKQVDFLEANSDFAICFHNTKGIYEDGSREPYITNPSQKEVTTFEDVANDFYIMTPSCVYRNQLFGDFPEWYFKLKFGDWPLYLLNAQYGKIKFMDDVMAVYRIHKGGAWSQKDEKYTDEYTIEAVEICREHFASRGREQFNNNLSLLYSRLCRACFHEGSYDDLRKYYAKYLGTAGFLKYKMLARLTAYYFLSYIPSLAAYSSSTLKKPKKI